MHFSKTYSQLLLTLPPDLRENAIEYRQLKKLINQVVLELTSLGLSPEVLHQILEQTQSTQRLTANQKGKQRALECIPPESLHEHTYVLPRVAYEINTDSDQIQPRLRLVYPDDVQTIPLASVHLEEADIDQLPCPSGSNYTSDGDVSSDDRTIDSLSTTVTPISQSPNDHELVIPLASDTAFFQTLLHAHHTLSTYLTTLRNDMIHNIDDLSRSISSTARPMSSQSPHFHAYSQTTSNPAAISVSPPGSTFFSSYKSDLYAWREIFQLYIDSDVFVGHTEEMRGERAVEDAEERLTSFMKKLTERDLTVEGKRLVLKQSKEALMKFLQLNAAILNLLKFQYATAEATRKILKKHAKRTALPFVVSIPSPFIIDLKSSSPSLLSPTLLTSSLATSLIPTGSSTTLASSLVQAIGQNLLPIIPHIDDYSCVICMNIAFKPIRLRCGHLFCVRCLVKMQKRGQDNCPFCRAPTVLTANRSNVDWALLNFMKDWFPIESRKKLRQNEQEAAEEEMEELGLNTQSCVIA
ncbi:hypothetical protein ABKN59_009543 [Abortiporus biennis]